MTESSAKLQLAIALPLGVVANQLARMEADLRFLNMKALNYAKERDSGALGAGIAGPLDQINESLDRIRALVSDIEADLRPKFARRAADSASAREAAGTGEYGSGKPSPQRDD